MVLRIKNKKFGEFTILSVFSLCLSLKQKTKSLRRGSLSILFTEPIFIEVTKRNGILNRVICVTHSSNGFKVEQSGTQTISDLSGIECLSRNRVLVKNFLNPKNSGERSREKRFSIWKTPGAESIECLLILNIYTFFFSSFKYSLENISIFRRRLKYSS